jgi:TM2 domain-containing membrane protein YozV
MSETTNTTGGEQKPAQKKMTMAIVCWFLGALGIHRLMMGYKNWWVMLVLTIITCGAVGYIWGLIDFVKILTGSMKMADGRELEK